MLVLAGCAALLLVVGLAGAAPGNGGGREDHVQLGPVDITGEHGAHMPRAGFAQGVPTNLGGLKAPKGRAVGSFKAGIYHAPRLVHRARSTRQLSSATATPPTPTLVSSASNPTYDTFANFSFTDTDATVTFQCRLDGASFAACTSPQNYPGPIKFGSHTFRVRAVNSAGTTSANAVYSWTISPPPAPQLTSTPGSSTPSSTATFQFTDALATATFQCSLDGSSYSTCVSGQTYSSLPAGKHTFRVRALDASGAGAATSYSWTILRTAPPTLTAFPTNPTSDRSASFSFTDSDATATFLCRLDSSSYTACTSTKTYAGPLAYGSHTFQVEAVTGSGTSTPTKYSWSILPPAPTLTSQPSDPTTSTSASFVFSDTVPVAYVCSLDSATFAACTSPKNYTNLALGTHTFQVRAVAGGVQSISTSATWTIKAPPPPTPTITAQPTNPSSSTSAQFTFTDTDATATFECSMDSAAFAPCTSPASYTLTTGDHTFQVRATNSGGTSDPASYSWTINALQVKMRLLVISGNGTEQYDFAPNPNCSPNPCKGAIQTYLDDLGVPYDTMIASQTDPSTLADKLGLNGNTGNYDGIILATGNLAYFDSSNNFVSGFTSDEWQTLWNYEAKFHVRQVTSFTYPGGPPDNYGLTYAGETGDPVQATLTDAGKQVFSYLNPSATISIVNAYTYLATTTDPSVTPLLTTSQGYVIASTRTYADGRENLAITSANAPWELHTKLLSYGIVNWLTRGLFLGSRHVTMDTEIDDLLIDSDIWNPTTHSDAEGLATSMTYRLTPGDFQAAAAWQSAERSSNPNLSQLKLEFAFNGEGAFGSDTPPNFNVPPGTNSPYQPDTLSPEVVQDQADFCYINHTYAHENLDLSSYSTAANQIQWNQQSAQHLGLGCYSNQEFVQPDISGLTNTNFLQAAYDNGIRYMITDTSQPGWGNPSPNAGFPLGPGNQILAIPRHPSNLFYNLQTKDEWVDEYNWIYCTCSPSDSPWKFWASPLTYDQIVDVESDNLLSYLLSWDIDPWMFHQANLGLYDGQHSLLTDLLTATLQKYVNLYNIPILNETQQQVGELMKQRMAYDASGVDAVLVPCQSMTLTVQNSAAIPVTGLDAGSAGSTETYAGQQISTVDVTAGTPVTIPVSCS